MSIRSNAWPGLVLIPVLAGLLVLTGGCSSMKAKYDDDAATDFSGYRTYDFQPLTDETIGVRTGMRDFNARYVMQTTERVLAAKGIERVEEDPDFLIYFRAHVEETTDSREMEYTFDTGMNRETRLTDTVTYNVGTLVMDFIDAGTNERILRGWSEGVIENPDKARSKIEEAVTAICAGFPPQP
jgi:hypothetical protein